MKLFSVLALATVALAATFAAPAFAATWSYEATGGMAGPYQATPGTYGDSFGAGWYASGSTMRPLGSSLALRISAGWIHHSRVADLAQIPEDPPASLRQNASFMPVGLGMRWWLPSRPPGFQRVFVDASPMAVWSRWQSRYTQVGRGFNGEFIDVHTMTTMSRILPGAELGAGLAFPRGFVFGVHYVAAAAPGGVLPPLFSRRLQGLSQWTMAAGMHWE